MDLLSRVFRFFLLYGFLMLWGHIHLLAPRSAYCCYFFVSRRKTWVWKIFNKTVIFLDFTTLLSTHIHTLTDTLQMNVNWPPATSFLDTHTHTHWYTRLAYEEKTTSCFDLFFSRSQTKRPMKMGSNKTAWWFIAQLKHLNRHIYNFPNRHTHTPRERDREKEKKAPENISLIKFFHGRLDFTCVCERAPSAEQLPW